MCLVSDYVSVLNVNIRNQENELNVSCIFASYTVCRFFNHAVLRKKHNAALVISIRNGKVCHYVRLGAVLKEWNVRGLLLERYRELASPVCIKNIGAVALNAFFQRNVRFVASEGEQAVSEHSELTVVESNIYLQRVIS